MALAAVCLSLAACGASGTTDCNAVENDTRTVTPGVPEDVDGLEAKITTPGRDDAVGTGDIATVHYTGWLYDPEAEDGRGQKFDSSRDRGQPYGFPVGGRRVIQGWDLGVVGMQIGEVRELTIESDLGYGDSGRGSIPPGATMLFEVELVSFQRCTTYE